MASPSAPSKIEFEIDRIRELSQSGRHLEALTAAQTLVPTAPQHRDVLYLIAANQRCLDRLPDALATLQRLQQQHPRFSLLYQERGYCYVSLRDANQAIDAFLQGVNLNPALLASWKMLERLYQMVGESENTKTAAERILVLKKLPPEIVHAGSLFSDGDLSAAENILRGYLNNVSSHAEALRLLARIVHQRNVLDEAEILFEAALKLAPDYQAARLDYVRVLMNRQKYSLALEEIHRLLTIEPENNEYLSYCAAALAGLGRHALAIALYRQLIEASPESSEFHVALGHSLKSIGRQKETIESYRMAAAIRPGFGDAWWSLANLKTYRFSEEDIVRMCTEESSAVDAVDRYQLCFALGNAYEERNQHAKSWHFYERGNSLKHAECIYRSGIMESETRRQIEECTAPFFAARAGAGAPNPDPIFILGLPRSGSTLLEQILASHSQVEGTQELSDIHRIVLEMQGARSVTELSEEDFREAGEQYLTDTRIYRSGKPFFIDKMPNNFRHIGLIHLMLPNATIVDARREPMACCFSNLKQLFASGQEFSYSIEDMARYYRTYLELMRHWDSVLPGRILRVLYEDVVEDLEGNVRRILDYCNLKFEPGCLKFYETKRNVYTASSEQVRQPIFHEGLLQWRHYEPWLGPLKNSLGDALTRYRE